MKLNSLNQFIFRACLALLLISIISSCAPTPSPLPLIASPTPIPPQPTGAEPATVSDPSSLFKAGLSYSDVSGDMAISFLDVVAFQAAVNEETETLEVLLHMRDIPTTAPLGQVKNLLEYFWTVRVYLDPSKSSPADIPGDFYFALNTNVISPSSGNLTPIPGEPVEVPINELFENKNVLRSTGTNAAALEVIANPDLDTLLLRGRVPGIKSNAGFSFATSYYDGTQDRPDNIPGETAMFNAGLNYSDASGDMEVSFLDVTGFQATVNEATETLEVVLQLRDIPETATRRQIRNLTEYMWEISIFTDPAKLGIANTQADYQLFLMTIVTDPPTGEGVMTPVPGEPEIVPFDEFWDGKNVNDGQGNLLYEMEATADPDQDTITMRARIPEIKSEAAFRFATIYYDGTIDRPDSYVPPGSATVSTPLPESTQASQISSNIPVSEDPTKLTPVGIVTAYPGPEHYAGDVLTFEIVNDGSFGDETLDVSLTLDGNPPTEVSATSNYMNLLLPLALDTTNLSGQHTLKLTTADGRLNETYIFEVLPADQRPPNEVDASWLVHEIDCCVLHYISETAAARDIEFIAENFQQAAEEFATITGNDIDPKLDVYIMDRIWGNGGFGGNGELVISYFDRYYGPTIGNEGLQTLARHEFTHAAGVGLKTTGNGVDFNGEGLAVYVAGGHYKPEPLAERGAALLDLGHYVPITQFIPQHELSYLYPAAMLTYIVETYGMEKMWEFLGSDDNSEDDQPGSLEAALQATFGVSIPEFDESFQTWLEQHEPGEQLEDLRLTIELQDLRRQYQETYSPPPYFILASVEDAAARSEYLPVVIREARAPANIAVELLIAHAQQAIVEGDYMQAEELNNVLADIVSTGEITHPLAKEYLDIVLTLEEAGYETLSLNLQRNQASAEVTIEPPLVTSVELQKVDGSWQVQP